MGSRGSKSGMSRNASSTQGRSILSQFGGRSGVANATYNELSNQMGSQYRREYAESIVRNGADSVHFPDMIQYVARNEGVSLPTPENRPYREVVRDALGASAFNTIISGMQEGSQRWLDENPRRRRRT